MKIKSPDGLSTELDEQKTRRAGELQIMFIDMIRENFPGNDGKDFIYVNLLLQLVTGMLLKTFNIAPHDKYFEEFKHNVSVFFKEGGECTLPPKSNAN
jgi:hypothetical protein